MVCTVLISCGVEKKVILHAGEMSDGTLAVYASGMDKLVFLESGSSLEVPYGPLAIEAIGDQGYEFSYWNGVDGEDSKLFFNIEEEQTIGAVFVQAEYSVSLDEAVNGNVTVNPEVIPGKKYPANTVFTIEAEADAGFEIDSLYYAVPGPWWVDYFESPKSHFEVRLTSPMVLGASFMDRNMTKGIKVINDIVYAKPGVKELKYDLFSPENAAELPLLIIVHGGGWSSNSEDVMRGMAREIAGTGKYVVASIDYRWIGHLDGDPEPNLMHDLIGDVYGAMAHVIEHAEEYGADPECIVITGDSAGGHLSASAATMIERIGDGGFGEKKGVYEIMPTYLPAKMSVYEFRDFLKGALRAAAPSYGVFDVRTNPEVPMPEQSSDALRAVSPIFNIPAEDERSIPHFLVRGTADPLIRDEMVRIYNDALQDAGQDALYLQVPDAGHAFFDWKPDRETQAVFEEFGVPNIYEMLDFFDRFIK